MGRISYLFGVLALFISLASCEEVIDVDLNYADPVFVAEARIYKDSVSVVRLSLTASYFSAEEPVYIDNATVTIKDGITSEVLVYTGNGYYNGSLIIGTEETLYEIEIMYNGKVYKGTSYMPAKTDLISSSFGKSDDPSTVNPFGKTVFTIDCVFADDPVSDNFYLIRIVDTRDKLIEKYYLLTEDQSNSGNIENVNDTIHFAESIFYDGGEVKVQLYSVDQQVYNYFMQLNDVLFWKRRVMPPTPYNPVSNIDNGVQGYFAAWAYDSETLILE
ncbi:MAG: DUF4249 family protein [Bacteroidia bacterium]|nr:MAG: DUF4249 family protein [Bacteroidia bacterium]